MKYLVRILIVLMFIPGFSIFLFGFLLTIFLTFLQYPLWFILKGEFLEDEDTILVWYVSLVGYWVEKLLEWSCVDET